MPGRGLEEMIEALPLLPGLQLRAIGPGATGYRSSLLERAARLGVADQVDLPGPVAPDDVQAALAGATFGLCLIQPICRSYELSLPNKLFEYVAAGLPILASDLPVIAEVVRGSRLGEVVSPGDPSSIAAGVRRLLDPAVRAEAVAHVLEFVAANPGPREAELLADVYQGLGGTSVGSSRIEGFVMGRSSSRRWSRRRRHGAA
jgi:glycosyltransferase involved in cell wall biosynthesis